MKPSREPGPEHPIVEPGEPPAPNQDLPEREDRPGRPTHPERPARPDRDRPIGTPHGD